MEDNHRSRSKRQSETYEYTPTKTRCPLLLVADYRFYQEMGASSTKTTINYLVCTKRFTPIFSSYISLEFSIYLKFFPLSTFLGFSSLLIFLLFMSFLLTFVHLAQKLRDRLFFQSKMPPF